MRLPICFSADENYAQHMGITMASVLKNKRAEDEIYFYVLDGGISDSNKRKLLKLKYIASFGIEFIQADKSIFTNCPIYKNDHVSVAAYYRIVLPEVCPGEDKLIYLDCDIIVNGSLADLFKTDLGDYCAGAVKCIFDLQNKYRLGLEQTYNSGVLLINAKNWRRDKITEKCFRWIEDNNAKVVLHDQDTLNVVLKDKIKPLNECWNTQIYNGGVIYDNDEITRKSVILHNVGKNKPWSHAQNPMGYLYFKYIKLTPWRFFGLRKHFTRFVRGLPVRISQHAGQQSGL